MIGTSKEFDFKDYAKAIRYVGVDHCILSSDMGQPGNPLHTDGLTAFYAGLREQGFTQVEIDRMAKENPARLIGVTVTQLASFTRSWLPSRSLTLGEFARTTDRPEDCPSLMTVTTSPTRTTA